MTDFAKRFEPCSENQTGGACDCMYGVLGLPPVMGDQTPGGAVTFPDTRCTATYASACLPRTIPTDAGWEQPPPTHTGQILIDQLLDPEREPASEFSLRDKALNWNWNDLPLEYGDLGTNEVVAEDVNREFRRGCFLAHFSVLSQEFLGVLKDTPEWRDAINILGAEYNPQTSYVNPSELQWWGQTPGVPITQLTPYATHAVWPVAQICQEDATYPFGFLSVTGPAGPAGITNPPPPQPGVSPRLAVRQRVVLDTSSAGLLTLSGIGSVAISFSGVIEASLSNCDALMTTCPARLGSVLLETQPFEFQGYSLRHVRITSTNEAAGVFQDDTLLIDSFTAHGEGRLVDGKYDLIDLDSGALLARWDVDGDEMLLVFSFSSTLNDGTELMLNGTATGHFENVSPRASAELEAPATEDPSGELLVECSGPGGTSIQLSGEDSFDREDGEPRLRWFSGASQIAETGVVGVSDLGIGPHEFELRAYDSQGFGDNERIRVVIVDTTPPVIEAEDRCIGPPNHRRVLLRLGSELLASATDQCDGGAGPAPKIVDVQSSSGSGVISWTDDGVCVEATRSGAEGDRTYVLTLEARDSQGNAGTQTLNVTVPQGPFHGCMGPKDLAECGDVP